MGRIAHVTEATGIIANAWICSWDRHTISGIVEFPPGTRLEDRLSGHGGSPHRFFRRMRISAGSLGTNLTLQMSQVLSGCYNTPQCRVSKPHKSKFCLVDMTEQNSPIIGYSGFDVFEECYGYDEDACYIADTEAAAHHFMQVASMSGAYRIEPVTLSRIMDDFGFSLGEFTMERTAFTVRVNLGGLTEDVIARPRLTPAKVRTTVTIRGQENVRVSRFL